MKKQWTSILLGILLIWPSLLAAQQKKTDQLPFCAYCGGVYSLEKKMCPRENFPLILSNSSERKWVLKEQKKLTSRPSRSKFYRSFTLHQKLLKKGGSSSIQASYYAALEKYAHFMEPKNADLSVTFLNEILLREKKTPGPFYQRTISQILQIWKKKAFQGSTEEEREKYLKKILRPGLFPEKLVEKSSLYEKSSLSLSKIFFRRGLEKLKRGIEQNSFEDRFIAEDTWFTIDVVLKDKDQTFYKFVETCRLYFDLEAFYNLKKYKLVWEVIEQMERDFARYPVGEFPPSKLPFWKKMHQIKKELRKSEN